jgi:hypothetical protein
MRHDYLCRVGAICTRDELSGFLRPHGVKRYKVMIVDDELVADWEKADWTPIENPV